MRHFITIAIIFQSRPECWEYLKENTKGISNGKSKGKTKKRSKDEKMEDILSWKSIYESGVTHSVFKIEAGGKNRTKGYIRDEYLHSKSSNILMTYMKQLVNGNRIMDKSGYSNVFLQAQQCYEEYERVEKFIKDIGITEEMKTEHLKIYMSNLLEVI
jgi:hypothetical protein